MSLFTILGARGYIGSHLSLALRAAGHDVRTPERDAPRDSEPCGHIIYAIGVTGDFRQRPHDTVTAHVTALQSVLREAQFDSLTYLSSTRVYQGLPDGADEQCELHVQPSRPDDLYNLSKLMGESLGLHSGRPVKIVRLSNVFGGDFRSANFLTSILRAAITTGDITLHSAPTSAKDYISIHDVTELLPRIALKGQHAVYNLASGANVTHGQLTSRIAQLTGCKVRHAPQSPEIRFPSISTARIQAEFPWQPRCVLGALPALVAEFQNQQEPVAC